VLTSWIAKVVLRPVSTTMVTITLLLFGLVAALRLPVELLPELSYPTITVRTTEADAAPSEIEELVTRPIEERVGAVPGVVKVESVSREGTSDVVLDFAWGTAMDQAMADVREKLDRVTLPLTASRPLLLRYDPSQEPILRLALRSTEGTGPSPDDLAVLRKVADDIVKRGLEKISGVAAVQVHGGELEEIAVDLDMERLAALGVGAEQVVAALQRENINRPGGAVDERDDRYLVRTLNEAHSAEDIGAIVVRNTEGRELRVRDIAKVSRRPLERTELSLVGGHEAVELAVYREGDANLVAVAQDVIEALPRMRLVAGYEIVVLANQAKFIESSVDEVVDNTLIGGVMAILVLLFFLRDLGSTLVIAVAIPISLLATFVPMQALGVSLNVMSLGGLALGVGMLVDNSIVVLEAVARVRAQDGSRRDAESRRRTAVQGTGEVASSVVASTLTTIAVFLPMAFVEGIAGQLVRDLSLAVSFSILSSMLVSLTLVPVLMSLGGIEQGDDATTGRRSLVALLVIPFALVYRLVAAFVGLGGMLLGMLARPFTAIWDALERTYPWLLRRALRHPGVVAIVGIAVCVVTVPLLDRHGRTLVPEVPQHDFFVQIELPQGTALGRTEQIIRTLGAALDEEPAIELHFARIGSITAAGSAGGTVTGTHLGQIDVRLASTDTAPSEAVEHRVLERMRDAMPVADARLVLGRPTLIAFGPPIEVQVFAEDARASAEMARTLVPELLAIESLPEVVADDLDGRPEVRVTFDRERLGRAGLSVDVAASAVQRALVGEVATQLHLSDKQIDVRVRLPIRDRSSVEDVGAIVVGVVGGRSVRLDSVAAVDPGRGPAEIRRIDGRRGLRIRARTDGVNLGGVAAEIQTILDANADSTGRVSTTISGQAGQMQSSLDSIIFTAALSLFLVYVVMAATFEHLLHPFLILFTVPLAIAGVAVGCDLAGLPLSAMVGIGIIVLGGIVVNNAIVLVAAINDRRGAGMPLFESVIDAGRARLRPILMTTLTTVLGLVPMAMGLGDGAALRQPLAVSIMGGLSSSTFLTLVVIPAVYLLLPGRVQPAWRNTEGDHRPSARADLPVEDRPNSLE